MIEILILYFNSIVDTYFAGAYEVKEKITDKLKLFNCFNLGIHRCNFYTDYTLQ